MRSRRTNLEHQEAVSRRLALLGAELAGVRADSDPEPRPWRLADPELAVAFQAWETPHEAEFVEDAPLQGTGFPGRHAARRRGHSLTAVVPADLRHRFAFGPAHFAVLAVIVAVGLGLTAWWAIRSRPLEVAPSSELVAQNQPPQVLPTESPLLEVGGEVVPAQQPTQLVVDVSGKVRRPGIAVLEPGARVVDALEAAGGARRGADLSALNLARLVIDGEQILVGLPQPTGLGAAAAAPAGNASGALVNLNSADQPQLETLPGIGPVTAQAIMAWRTEHNGFGAVEELLDVDGIGEATLAQLAPHVTI